MRTTIIIYHYIAMVCSAVINAQMCLEESEQSPLPSYLVMAYTITY
jgi:hypothetical protein